jgi:hypothetical protein
MVPKLINGEAVFDLKKRRRVRPEEAMHYISARRIIMS